MTLARRGGVAYSPSVLFEWRWSGENVSAGFADVAEKLEAGERFRAWARRYMETLVPGTDEDAALLAAAPRGLDRMVDAMSFWTLRHAPLCAGWRAVCALRPRWPDRVAYLSRLVRSSLSRRLSRPTA